jgi:hypothetical protein
MREKLATKKHKSHKKVGALFAREAQHLVNQSADKSAHSKEAFNSNEVL